MFLSIFILSLTSNFTTPLPELREPGVVVPIPTVPKPVTTKTVLSVSPVPKVLGPPTWNLWNGSVFATPTLPGFGPVLIPVSTVPATPTSNLCRTNNSKRSNFPSIPH